MRGRSFTALRGRTLNARTGVQSPSGTAPTLSRQVGLIEPALEVAFVPSSSIFCAEGAFGGLSVSAGASAIASRGSRSCCRLKMPKLIAPAINPQTKNATNVRHNLEVPTYPNSGCRTRTRDTTTTHAPIPPSYHSPSSALGQNYILVNCADVSSVGNKTRHSRVGYRAILDSTETCVPPSPDRSRSRVRDSRWASDGPMTAPTYFTTSKAHRLGFLEATAAP